MSKTEYWICPKCGKHIETFINVSSVFCSDCKVSMVQRVKKGLSDG